MRKKYLLLISVVLIALLALAACAPVWGPAPYGRGGMMAPQQPPQGQPYPYTPGGGMGPGMMGGGMMGSGMMGSMMGSGMMGSGMMGYYSGVPTPLSHDNAKVIAGQYLVSLNNPDLEIDELEEYSHNFYASLIEKSTGRGAIEIIIDRYSGSLQAEPQSMMWNTKYSMMGGYQQANMTVTPQQALKIAQDFLDVVNPGTEAGEVVSYYGYYTIMTTLGGKHYGMVSVNGYSGDVWYHIWHGMFLSEVE